VAEPSSEMFGISTVLIHCGMQSSIEFPRTGTKCFTCGAL